MDQENIQNSDNLGENTFVSEAPVGNKTSSKPAVRENKMKTVVPFLILGLVAILLGVAMVYAYNLANNGVDKAETPVNTNTQNTVVEEEPVVENLNPEEDMVNSTLEEIDDTISTLDEETTFNDMDTAEFGF